MQTRSCLLFISLYLSQFDDISLQNKTQNAFKRAQIIEVDLIHDQKSTFNFGHYNKNTLRIDLKLHYSQTFHALQSPTAEFQRFTELHYSQTSAMLLASLIAFQRFTELHYSQTGFRHWLHLLLFQRFTELHYSQTSSTA